MVKTVSSCGGVKMPRTPKKPKQVKKPKNKK